MTGTSQSATSKPKLLGCREHPSFQQDSNFNTQNLHSLGEKVHPVSRRLWNWPYGEARAIDLEERIVSEVPYNRNYIELHRVKKVPDSTNIRNWEIVTQYK